MNWIDVSLEQQKLINTEGLTPADRAHLLANLIERDFALIDEDEKKKRTQTPRYPLSAEDIYKNDYGEYQWIVNNLIPRQGITMISGAPKSGKSWFLLHLLACIVNNQAPFQGQNLPQERFKVNNGHKILLIDEENSLRGLQRRMKKLPNASNLSDNIRVLNQTNFKIDNPDDRAWLVKYIGDNNIGLVVFDSFIRTHSKDENISKDMTAIYDNLKEIGKTGTAIILIHHNRKVQQFEKLSMESARGSSDIGAMVESFILLQSEPLTDLPGNKTVLLPILRESADLKPFVFDWFDDENGQIQFCYKGEINDKKLKAEVAKEKIMAILKERTMADRGEINALIGEEIGRDSIRKAISELTNEGVIECYEVASSHKKIYQMSIGNKPENEEFGGW